MHSLLNIPYIYNYNEVGFNLLFIYVSAKDIRKNISSKRIDKMPGLWISPSKK